MDIYKFSLNDKYKFFLFNNKFQEMEKSKDIANGFAYGDFNNDFPYINLEVFNGKTKKEKNANVDFNISAFSGDVFVSNELARLIYISDENIQFIKAHTNNGRDFFYVNPNNIMDILDFNNQEELFEMLIEDKYRLKDNLYLNDCYLFRDKNIPYSIFATERFKNEYEDILFGADLIRLEPL